MLVPFDVPAGHHRGAREVLLRPARGADAERRATRSTSGSTTAAGGVPRLGRLQPPRRDALARGLLDRGGVPRQARRATCPGRPRAASGPGPIRPGRWSAELGLAAIAGRDARRRRRPRRLARRGRVLQRPGVRRPALPQGPLPAPSPSASKAGWYTGDLHVHAEHSALGDATMTRDLRLRVRRGEARLHHADRLRDGLGLGRDRPLQDRPPPRRPLVGGHHLPRAHEQPALRPLRRLPHRARSTTCAPTAA